MPAPRPYTASLNFSASSICNLAKPMFTRSIHASTHSIARNGISRQVIFEYAASRAGAVFSGRAGGAAMSRPGLGEAMEAMAFSVEQWPRLFWPHPGRARRWLL